MEQVRSLRLVLFLAGLIIAFISPVARGATTDTLALADFVQEFSAVEKVSVEVDGVRLVKYTGCSLCDLFKFLGYDLVATPEAADCQFRIAIEARPVAQTFEDYRIGGGGRAVTLYTRARYSALISASLGAAGPSFSSEVRDHVFDLGSRYFNAEEYRVPDTILKFAKAAALNDEPIGRQLRSMLLLVVPEHRVFRYLLLSENPRDFERQKKGTREALSSEAVRQIEAADSRDTLRAALLDFGVYGIDSDLDGALEAIRRLSGDPQRSKLVIGNSPSAKEVRMSIVFALSHLKDPRVVQYLVEACADPHFDVKRMAILALSRTAIGANPSLLEQTDRVSVLVNALQNPH